MDVANTLTNLAEVLRSQSKYVEAEGLLKRAIPIYESKLGKESPILANAYNNLALLYRNQNKLTLAEPLYKQAIAVYEKSESANIGLVATLNNYAELLQAANRSGEANTVSMRAQTIKTASR